MANFDTGTDILQHIIRRAGEILPTETTTTNADHLIDAKLYINQAYWDLCALKPWRWNKKRKQFRSTAETTGTVTTISTTTVTLSATVATSMAGRKFMLDSDAIPHRITSHTGGTATVVLEASYTGSNTSGAYTIFEDEIDTGQTDILAFPLVRELHWGDDLKVVPEGELRKEYPRNVFGTTRAQYAAFITDAKILIAPWTKDARLFEVVYNYRPTALDFAGGATDTPVLPQDSRVAIAQRALAKIYADKRDERLEVVQKELDETLARMSATETTFGKPRLKISRGSRVS